ncbi:hypothetical protein HAX54_010678, partial [Datura stramonium]|nr:hypothetical protein [Datura stramonium]
ESEQDVNLAVSSSQGEQPRNPTIADGVGSGKVMYEAVVATAVLTECVIQPVALMCSDTPSPALFLITPYTRSKRKIEEAQLEDALHTKRRIRSSQLQASEVFMEIEHALEPIVSSKRKRSVSIPKSKSKPTPRKKQVC